MLEIAFYHLTRATVEQTLPTLLERTRARGWRAIVQATSEARLAKLDADLWSYRPESFLPHGTKTDGAQETQPIYLSREDDNPNDAEVRFFIEGARIARALAGAGAPRERAALIFDGRDEAELADARAQWKELRDLGYSLVYHQQSESGGWEEKAREPKS
ncbi:MAG: DNA polymerase III subunit chi [Alphaproteobacteria bacterium]|jgi:DNA polymerase-3 subunit chi|nr:DNA polymerase III subunit chi [Alphaproteobacteria bacterium]MBM3625273.1 DNA polymerase III subunit chi [Alphaproteobacteria bacterium]